MKWFVNLWSTLPSLLLVHQYFWKSKPAHTYKKSGVTNQIVNYTPAKSLWYSLHEVKWKVLSLLVKMEYRLVNCTVWLIFLINSNYWVSPCMYNHKDIGTTKHQFNDTDIIAIFLSFFGFKSIIVSIVQSWSEGGGGGR